MGPQLFANVIDSNTAHGDENSACAIWWHNIGNRWYVSKKGIKDVLKFFPFSLYTHTVIFVHLAFSVLFLLEGKNVQNLSVLPTVYFKMFTRHTACICAYCKDVIGLWVQQGFQDHIFVLHK